MDSEIGGGVGLQLSIRVKALARIDSQALCNLLIRFKIEFVKERHDVLSSRLDIMLRTATLEHINGSENVVMLIVVVTLLLSRCPEMSVLKSTQEETYSDTSFLKQV